MYKTYVNLSFIDVGVYFISLLEFACQELSNLAGSELIIHEFVYTFDTPSRRGSSLNLA